MRKTIPLILFTSLLTAPLSAAESAAAASQQQQQPASTPKLSPFTGKVLKNRVRLRSQPSLDGTIVRELQRGDLFVVDGECDDFYAVIPPKDMRAYVFRTFILDNVVEGNRVNVRLEPNTDATILCQLNSGDAVTGKVVPNNNKWLEIAIPDQGRLYVSKDLIEKAGDQHYLALVEKRRDELQTLIKNAETIAAQECQKPFVNIDLNNVAAAYQKIIDQYQEFSQEVADAREAITAIQEEYLQKKIAYLEEHSKVTQDTLQAKNSILTQEVYAHQHRLKELEQKLQTPAESPQQQQQKASDKPATALLPRMAAWLAQEERLYDSWTKAQGQRQLSLEDFYAQELSRAMPLQGVVESYDKAVKNKPGDYILINGQGQPIAFLYSTQVNLSEYIGKNISIMASRRPDNHFAYKAYFVHNVN